MAVRIGSNIDALRGVRALSQSTKALDDIYTRLSSGLRINRAGDDPAGLSVSETLRSDRRVYGQAIRNVGDMISLLSVQDSALEALSQIVTRQLELSTQAINGSYSFEQRKAMHTEANALTKEYNRIVESTKFNGIKVLEDPDQQLSIQIGKSSVQFNLAQDLSRPIGILEYNTGVTYPVTSGGPIEMTNGDMNNDGITDIIAINWGGNNISVHIANGDGTFKAPIERNAGASAYDVAVGDLNGDGILDVVTTDSGVSTTARVFLGNGDGSLQAATNQTVGADSWSVVLEDVDNDGHLDIVALGRTDYIVSVLRGNGDGTFKTKQDTALSTNSILEVEMGDFNNDGVLDLLTGENALASVRLGHGDGSFGSPTNFPPTYGNTRYMAVGDFNQDGIDDFALAYNNAGGNIQSFLSNGDGTFRSAGVVTVPVGNFQELITTDLNGDGILDLASVDLNASNLHIQIGRGDGTFQNTRAISTVSNVNSSMGSGDFNNDGVIDLVVDGANGPEVLLAKTEDSNLQQYFSLYHVEDAKSALDILKGYQERISGQRATTGSAMSRLNYALQDLNSKHTVYGETLDRVVSADIAQETADMVRHQLLQKIATAILGQANLEPQLALKLLG